MKKYILISTTILITTIASAQNNKVTIIEEKIIDTTPRMQSNSNMQNQKVVTITMHNNKNKSEKMLVEIDGDKIKVNGKDASEIKDIDININENKVIFQKRNGKILDANDMNDMHNRMMEMNGKLNNLNDKKIIIEKHFNDFMQPKVLLGIGMEKVENGVKIIEVHPETGAAKAGLLPNDIITKIDTTTIITQMDITKIISKNKPGDIINVTYLRNAKINNTKVTLGERKMEESRVMFKNGNLMLYNDIELKQFKFNVDGNMPDVNIYKHGMEFNKPFNMNRVKLGLRLTELEKENGLEIIGLEENSIAEKAGLLKGDIITTIGNNEIKNIGDIKKAMDENKEKPLSIKYLRNGKIGNTVINIPKKLHEISL